MGQQPGRDALIDLADLDRGATLLAASLGSADIIERLVA
jgi:hypothetical protein